MTDMRTKIAEANERRRLDLAHAEATYAENMRLLTGGPPKPMRPVAYEDRRFQPHEDTETIEHPLDMDDVFKATFDARIGRLADRAKAALVAIAVDELEKLDFPTRITAICGTGRETADITLACAKRAEARFFEAVEGA